MTLPKLQVNAGSLGLTAITAKMVILILALTKSYYGQHFLIVME